MNETSTQTPPARPEQGIVPHGQAALLIDFDNVTMGIRSNLGQELRKLLSSDIIKGKVSIQRAYADWRRYPQYIVPLAEASIDLIFAPAYGSSKKNATDIRLSIDALEIVFTRPDITTFILLSGDSDFSSLVLKLKEHGKYVIGVGIQESSSDLLVQNCDEYYSYSSLSGLTSALELHSERFDPWDLVGRAIGRMVERKDVMRSDRLKQVMLELDANFSEKEIGFSKFNRFLVEAASRGIISLRKAANGQYDVAPGESRPAGEPVGEPSAAAEPRRREPREEGRGRREPRRRREARGREEPRAGAPPHVDEGRLRAAYDLLRTVVDELALRGEPVRDSEVKRRMREKDAEFDEAALGFRKFSRFLHQAHDEEVVNLERGPEGNYKLSPLGVEEAGEGETAGRRSPRERRDGSGRGRRGRRSGRARERGEAAAVAPTGTEVGREPVAAEAPAAEMGERVGRPGSAARKRTAGGEGGQAAREAQTEADRRPAAALEGDRGAAGLSAAREAGAAGSEPSAEAEARRERRRTLGRFRRGGRGRGAPLPPASRGAEDARAGFVPGPTDATTGSAAGPTSVPTVPDPTDAEPEYLAGSSREARPSGLVEHMTRNYPGVGRRTAERLVAEFGSEVLKVIDREPERVAQVLPEHRARAVLAGRRAERAGGGEEGAE
ncbi:MAG: NYN domain-containing protein [Gemmatimonadota bacterium]